jgi:hypothetical protein
MFCDAKLFATMGLKVCLKGQASAPPKIQTPPRLPCRTDAQCAGALVCAQFMGRRDCTLPCASDPQCKPPKMMGMQMDFMRCLPDEGNASRRACLPRKECMNNPMACMGMGNMGSLTLNMNVQMQSSGQAQLPGLAQPQVQPHAPARGPSLAPVKPQSAAMSAKRFAAFLAEVKEQNFESERNDVIGLAAQRNRFSCAQVSQLLKGIDFASEQISALKLMNAKIVDKEDSHLILKVFTFDSDKSKARKVLSR